MTPALHTSYRLVVDTLSPVHIASGKGDLLSEYDFVMEKQQALVIDLDRLLADTDETRLQSASSDPRLSRLLAGKPAARYAAYTLAVPGGEQPTQVREHIKDAFQKIYIPGSSLKGAIRTALAWANYDEKEPLQRGWGPKTADDPLERKLFGYDLRETHRDLFRALRVVDAYPQGSIRPQALPATVFSLRGQPLALQPRGNPTYVEAIPRGVVLGGALTLDEYALKQHTERPEATLYQRRHLLDKLAEQCRSFSAALVDTELDFYGRYRNPALQNFYQGLKERQASLKPEEFHLWLGWGPGWQAKTVGTKLKKEIVDSVATEYNLSRWLRGLNLGIFPKTRRLIGQRQGESPLGWVKIGLLPRETG